MKKRIEKEWGWEEILEKNDKYVIKLLYVKEGHKTSKQYHKKKRETILTIGDCGFPSSPSHDVERLVVDWFKETIFKVPPQKIHRIGEGVYLEISTPELDDVVRLEDDYGRANK